MADSTYRFFVRVGFTDDQARTITNVCEDYKVSPEAFVRHAALNAVTIYLFEKHEKQRAANGRSRLRTAS